MCSVFLFTLTTTNPEQTCALRDNPVGSAVFGRVLDKVAKTVPS